MCTNLELFSQACKTAIRESIEAEIRREREYRDNPEMVRGTFLTLFCYFLSLRKLFDIGCRE